MDFHGMKRKQLQALCKKHGVPANLTNRDMADRLASTFKENEEPVSVEKLSKIPEDIVSENGAEVAKRQAKKVRFSPENQTFLYDVSVYMRPTRRSRKQLLSKNPARVMENTPNSEDIGKVEECQVGVTRSRVQKAVEDGVNTFLSAPVAKKRGRRDMKNKDCEVNDIDEPEVVEMGDREDAKNGNNEVTGGLPRWQLRSRKNITQEDSKKVRKGKGCDEVHLLDENVEQSDVVREDVKTRNDTKRPTRNGRKEGQSVELSGEVENVEVVSRLTRQSRAQSKAVASIVKSEVKTVGVQGGCEEVLQLKELKKGRGKNALRQDAVPQKVSADNSLFPLEGAEAEKPLRRSKRNVKKDWTKSGTVQVQSETQVTKPQEKSGGDVALEDRPECVRRYSSRRKSVGPLSGKGENEEEFAKRTNKKRTRTTDLDAILEHSGEVERAAGALTSQGHVPLKSSRRKTVILNTSGATDAELANKEDIGKMQQLRASFLGKDVTEELPRKSTRNSSRYSSEISKEDETVFAEADQGLKLQTKEPNVEEEKRSVVEEHPITEKSQRRSKRITSRSASVAPLNPIATVVKKQQNKYGMTIIEEDAALTEGLSFRGELAAGKDRLVVVEGAENKNDLDLNVSREAVKNSDGCFDKKREELRGNSEAKQRRFGEDSPLFVDMEEDKDYAGKMEENLITTSLKLVGLSTDQEIQQSAHKSMEFYERESNLLGDDRQTLVHGGNVESEMNCVSYQSVNIKCALDDASCADQKFLEFEGNANHRVDSSEITFPAESQVEATIASTGIAVKIGGHGMSVQEMKEDSQSALDSLVVYKEDRNNPVESEKDRLVQVDTAETDNEMNHHHLCLSVSRGLAVDGRSFVEPRRGEFESKVTYMEITSLGATSSVLNPEKQLETESTGGESANFESDRVNVDVSRTPSGEDQILVELNYTNVSATEFVREATFKDHLNEYDAISSLEKAEKMIGTNFSNTEGIPIIKSSVKAMENQESSAEFRFPILEAVCQNITEIQQSTYADSAVPETQVDKNTCRFEATIEATASGVSDQGMIADLHPGNAHHVHDSISTNEFTRLVKNEKISIHDDNFDGEMKYQSCLSLKGKGASDDSNLVEPRIVDFESNSSKEISPEIGSPAGDFSSASKSDLASRFSSCIEQVKQRDTKVPVTDENINSNNDSMDAKGSRTPFEEDQIKVQVEDASVTAAELIGEVLFNDLLNELGESIGLKRGSEIPLKKAENQSARVSSVEERTAITERSIEAMEKQEDGAEMDIVAKLTVTPNITEIKWTLSSEIATCRTPFGLARQSQDKQCCAGNTVSIARSEMCNQDAETSLVDDEEILDQDNTIEAETKYQPCLSLNKTDALDEALAEPRMFELESNANKVVCFDITSLADVCPSASEAKLADETSNELKLDRGLESEESPKSENLNYESDKIEVEDNKNSAQKDLNLMQLEDTNMNGAKLVPEVWDPSNELRETCVSTELEIFLKKAEEKRPDGPSGKEMAQTGSSVKINEMSEATAKIHNGTTETGEKIIMEMQWSSCGYDTFFISSPRPKVGSQDMQGSIYGVENAVSTAGYGMSCHQKIEENVKLVENEIEQTRNTERELFIGGKLIFDEGSEGKFLADGACCPIPDSTDSQCAKGKQTDITERSFNNVSLETRERHIREVFVGEETVSSEEKDNDPFSMKLHEHVLVDEGRNYSGEIVVNQPFNNDFAATMDSKGICVIREKDVGEADDIMEKIALSSLKVELGERGDCKMDAELYDNVIGVVSTEFPEDIPSASVRITVPFEKTNYGDFDDQSEEIATQRYCSSSIRLDGFASAVGIVDNHLKVCSTESILNSKNLQSEREVEDSDVNGGGPYSMLDYIYAKTGEEANKFEAASMVEETGQDDGGKTPGSYQRSFHGGRQEDVPSYVNTTCSKSEISLASSASLCSNIPVSCAEKELLPQVMDDTDDVGRTEISIDCKVAREERDECQKNTRGSDDVIDGSSVEKSRGDPEEIAAAKSDDCEGSVKIATFMDYNDGLPVNQPLYLDESNSFDQENEELYGSHLPDNGDSRGVGSCGKLDVVSSVKPEIVNGCSTISSVCATSFEHKYLENPEEPHILTNTEMGLVWPLWASEDEVQKPDANGGDSNHAALDKTLTECNSSDLKEGDYVPFSDVEDTKSTVKEDGPEAVQEIIETRKDVLGLNAAMADNSPLSKNSEVVAVVDHKEAFRSSQLELLSSQKKNMTAKKEGSRSVFAKQMTPSTVKSKNKSNLIPRTPKRFIIQEAKENEPGTKTEQVSSRTAPKTSSKRRPLERVWKY